MPESPESDSSRGDGVSRFAIESNGRAIDDSVQVISVQVRHAIGQIARARIELGDADMPTQPWAVADGSAFAPGAAIRISAGQGDDPAETIFVGIVVQLGMHIDGDKRSRLIVECRHRAVALTMSRRQRIFIDKTDSEAMEILVGEYGLAASVDPTTVRHRELVQYGATDWDFLGARAQANGLLVLPADDSLHVHRPDTSSRAAWKVEWGVDLIEFHADLDARAPRTSVKDVAWNAAQQAIVEAPAAQPAELASQGKLGSATFARIRGHMRFQGCAKLRPARLIAVAGVGQRFSGSVFVTAIEHEISDGRWTTRAEFGPPASALLPGIGGLHVGVVNRLDPEPAGEMRIRIHLPALAEADGTGGLVWARLAQWKAGAGSGAVFVPEVGDEVVVGFFNEDPGRPVVLASLYGTPHKPPV